MAFSPDGETLASGSFDHTINLWDTTEQLLPRPRRMVKISGDNQEGTPGSDLANPFVVEVRDQYGNPLQGIQVAYSVKSGGGMLGGRSTEVAPTTDAEGRTQSILTLGPIPGENIVVAAVRGLEPVTFRAVGTGIIPGTLTLSDYQTWNLPAGAIVRLGRGSHQSRRTGDFLLAWRPAPRPGKQSRHLDLRCGDIASSGVSANRFQHAPHPGVLAGRDHARL